MDRAHPYADPGCKICAGSGEMAGKHPVDGETVYVDCWCLDDDEEYVEDFNRASGWQENRGYSW